MLESWQIKALEHYLLDYQEWSDNAVLNNIYETTDEALNNKALVCANRMIIEANLQDDERTLEEKVLFITSQTDYENRVQRDTPPIKSLEELKDEKIQQLKNNNLDRIYKIYPDYKQLDIIARIGGYTDDDFNEMKTFLEAKIDEFRNIETQINNCQTEEELGLISVELI